MIQIATTNLTIAEWDGTPATLDVGLLEQHLGEAFRKLGYNGAWMAEDVSLTIIEKIHESDATLVTREQIDTMVETILNALGYSDVAAEYFRIIGVSPIDNIRREMHGWNLEETANLLEKSLPITHSQREKLASLCLEAVSRLNLSLVSPKLMLELATHILANDRTESAPGTESAKSPVCPSWEFKDLSADAQGMVSSGLLQPLPKSQFLPKARLAINFPMLARLYPDWWMPMSLAAALDTLIQPASEVLASMRNELTREHPLFSDSPSHVIVQGCIPLMEKDPNLWKKKNREEILSMLEQTLRENIADKVDFSINLSIK